MKIHRCETSDNVATIGANIIYSRAGKAISQRDQFTLALSGGSTPWLMLAKLAEYELPWDRVRIFQVDERITPDYDPERNLVYIKNEFTDRIPLPSENLHAMPVNCEDLDECARCYQGELIEVTGEPAVLDVIHLGLGLDGHTASLVPDDPVLETTDRDVDITNTYSGQRRMTLTFPIINRARYILWMITGERKAEMLNRMIQADREIPAGRVNQVQATVIADADALSGYTHT